MTIKAIFFDIDGTLVDSNDFHVLAWEEAFATIGVKFDRQVIHDQIGKGTDNLVPALLPDFDEDAVEKLGKTHGKVFKDRFLGKVRPFTDASDLLKHVHNADLAVVLASSASSSELEHYLGLLGVKDVVRASTSADDVANTKPAPDIFAVALKKVDLSPDEVIVVGDTPYDIEAAAKCGISAVAVRSGKFPDEALRSAGAVEIYDDTADLLANFSTSPLAE